MRTEEIQAIDKARRVIEEIVASHYRGEQALPSVGPTDFGFLSTDLQQVEIQLSEEDKQWSRLRAGLQMCLSTASVALDVSKTLMNGLADLPPKQREKMLKKCGDDALAASEAAKHAAEVLTGQERPETDAFFEVTRL